jgi:hypothetical protein
VYLLPSLLLSVSLPLLGGDVHPSPPLPRPGGPMSAVAGPAPAPRAVISGQLKTWHRVTLTFEGPLTREDAEPNPFRDFRLQVTFRNGHRSYTVPGFFAADGNAAETGAAVGNRWRVHFAPDAPGEWSYTASFRTGTDVAVDLDPYSGTPTAFDGASGSFRVAPTDRTGRDFRGKGILRYVGERYLRHAGTGEPFIKGGPGSPENLLAFHDFDGTRNGGRGAAKASLDGGLHRYAPHVRDWRRGDPAWRGDRGKALVGALNYIAGKGMNTVYFLALNWRGDGDDVWPWIDSEVQDRYDVSKLDQWEIVFSHMDSLGIAMTVLFEETELDTLFDGGRLGTVRKLYYRELVARFGHHLGITWNMGEETNHSPDTLLEFARYLHALDPYGHPIVIHNHVHLIPETFDPLLGKAPVTGLSFQVANPASVHERVIQYLDASAAAGRPWVVNVDEIGHYGTGLTPDGPGNNHDQLRREVLWGTLMAGGAGVEWYFGYRFPHADVDLEDWRSRDAAWDMTRHALQFFREHLPFDRMRHHDALTWDHADYVLARTGEVYAVYLPSGGEPLLELKEYPGARFSVHWYDPRAGGPLQRGSLEGVTGGSHVTSLGTPPAAPTDDWVVLVRRMDGTQ